MPNLRKNIHKNTQPPKILQQKMQQRSKKKTRQNTLQQMVHKKQKKSMGKQKRHRIPWTTQTRRPRKRTTSNQNRIAKTQTIFLISLSV